MSATLIWQNSSAQMLLPVSGKDFSVHQKFNPDFIKSHAIAEIRCEKERKRDGDRIRKTQLVEVYHFYTDGRVKMISSINYKLRDTAITYFEYVGDRVFCEVKNDAAGMYSYCYDFSEEGLPKARKYGRASRFKSLTASVEPERIDEVTSETYEHKRYDNQLHTTLHNSAGRPYQKEIMYFDAHGYLIEYRQSFVMSSAKLHEQYKYNAGGWIEEIVTNDGKKEMKIVYTYDKIGNILTEDTYTNGALSHHLEYVYSEGDMSIRAELTREEEFKRILINNYSYTKHPIQAETR